jgi:exopolyphosphatase/guanosine-5'-triphosphate,3'-diphosphate pyrophosphatase
MPSAVVLELGSHSLKAHFVATEKGKPQTLRFPWSLGQEVYDNGRVSRRSLAEMQTVVATLTARGFRMEEFFAIGTGALRDAEHSALVATRLGEGTGLSIRVLSGREEASLLAQGYLAGGGRVPALIADLGGGSLELVALDPKDQTLLRESLPLGAVRLHNMGGERPGPWDHEFVQSWIDRCFREEASLLRSDAVHATGGTVKAIGELLGRQVLTPDDIAGVRQQVVEHGAPQEFAASRQRVFLPGILVLEALLRHSGASSLHYTSISVGAMLLRRILARGGALRSAERNELLLKKMRLTAVHFIDPDEDPDPNDSTSKPPADD